MNSLYLYVKAFHVISVIAWMAALLYLPRLFVYHADSAVGSPQSEIFKIMERRLLQQILIPAMAASWVFGLIMVFGFGVIDWSSDIWFHVKLLLVIILSAFSGVAGRWRKDFEADRNTRPARFYRMVNEVPAVLMVAIVILVIARPF